jgi:thymidylate synthase ThyX
MYSKVIRASCNNESKPIITFEIECPTWVWWDILTHRQLSRNASSTRAIPTRKFRDEVKNNPGLPIKFTKNQKGMMCNSPYTEKREEEIRNKYKEVLEYLLEAHESLESEYDISKQDLNVLLTPFYQFKAVITATEWDNFFNLRVSPEAKPSVVHIATMMYVQYLKVLEYSRGTDFRDIDNKIENTIAKTKVLSSPEIPEFVATWGKDVELFYAKAGEAHLPYLRSFERASPYAKQISAARCARVSYKTFETGRYSDTSDDIRLCNKLLESGHLSPFEHVATSEPGIVSANFRDWEQYRMVLTKPSTEKLTTVDNNYIVMGK